MILVCASINNRGRSDQPERSDLGNPILTMTDKEIFNTFASVIDCPSASPFLKRLAQAGLVAMPQDKALILKTWPRLMMQYGLTQRGIQTHDNRINPDFKRKIPC